MAKRIEPKRKAVRVTKFALPELQAKGWFFTKSFIVQAAILAIVAFAFNSNTFLPWGYAKDHAGQDSIRANAYALDDDIIMRENLYVQKGTAGLVDIFSNDAYKSYYQSMGVEQQLAGGRYRPLSVATFAIEQQFFGECYGARAEVVRDSIFNLQKKGDSLDRVYGAGFSNGRMMHLLGERNTLTNKIRKANMDVANVHHFFQVFWFAVSIIILLWFLRECIFRGNTDIAFLATLLFAIHPIHTEVIANVKSRDEIFSLMFICLTIIFYFRFDDTRTIKNLVWSGIFFFLALLSKEYAIVTPVLIAFGLVIFRGKPYKSIWAPMAIGIGGLAPIGLMWVSWNDIGAGGIFFSLLFGVGLAYLIRRYAFNETKIHWSEMVVYVIAVYALLHLKAIGIAHAVDMSTQDPLNDPYMYATKGEKFLSKLNRLDDYLYLLIYPHPLVSDYSYQHFPYSKITDWEVWVSLLVNLALFSLTVWLLVKKHPMGFALLFYFLFFLMVNNVVFDIGATMGERLIYHSSVGFCMAVAWLLITGLEKLMPDRSSGEENARPAFVPQAAIMLVVFLLLAIPAYTVTKNRNQEWKNDYTLFTTDVKKHPNSALTNGNAGARYMDRGLEYNGHDTIIDGNKVEHFGGDTVLLHRYADTAIFYLARATAIHDKYVNGWLNLGLCYYYTGHYDLAAEAWSNAYAYFPSNQILLSYQQMLIARANEYAAKKDYPNAARFLGYACVAVSGDKKENPAGDAKVWADYAGASFMAKDFVSAKMAFQKAMNLNPQLQPQLTNGYRAADHNAKVLAAYQRDSTNVDTLIALGQSYTGTTEFYPDSRRLLEKALILRPGDARATNLLDSLGKLEAATKVPKP